MAIFLFGKVFAGASKGGALAVQPVGMVDTLAAGL